MCRLPHLLLMWPHWCEGTPAWLAHITLATWAIWLQLERAGSLFPLVMRALWSQALSAGLPTFSAVRPLMMTLLPGSHSHGDVGLLL